MSGLLALFAVLSLGFVCPAQKAKPGAPVRYHFGAAVMLILTLTFVVLLFWHPAAAAAHPHINPQAPFKFAWPIWTLLTINLYIKVMINAYAGLEQVAVFAGELKNAGRAIVLSAWIAAPAIVLIYALMTGSMLTYVPASQIDLAGPIPQVLAAAFGGGVGVWLGRVMILGLTVFTICSYSILTAETSRLPMVAGWDAVLPEWFTRLSPRYRKPVYSLLVIVGVAAVFSVLASLGTARHEAFQLLTTTGQVSFGIYYCAMFAVPPVCRVALWPQARLLAQSMRLERPADYHRQRRFLAGTHCGRKQFLGICSKGRGDCPGRQPDGCGNILARAAKSTHTGSFNP